MITSKLLCFILLRLLCHAKCSLQQTKVGARLDEWMKSIMKGHFFHHSLVCRFIVMDEKAQMEAAAQKMDQMNPETLKAQASALREMSPSQVRTMNPQMAGFTDSQILQAADQMEEVKDDWRFDALSFQV